MRSNKIVGLGIVMTLAVGCQKGEVQQAAPEAGPAAATAAPPPSVSAASEEVAPPPPVVAGDPDVPLNEAVVGAAPVPADYSADVAPTPPGPRPSWCGTSRGSGTGRG